MTPEEMQFARLKLESMFLRAAEDLLELSKSDPKLARFFAEYAAGDAAAPDGPNTLPGWLERGRRNRG
jgi:hypothetical protein